MAIELYLIRHGLAGEHGSYANDDERPLTDEGKKKTRQVAKRLKNLGLCFDFLLTSPLVRAQQTAAILKEVGLADSLQETADLAPGGQLESWVEWLSSLEKPDETCVALVGHEPGLSQWAEQLIWGTARGGLTLKKAGVVGLMLPTEGSPIANSTLFWLTPPRFLLTD